ncbi:MAG TPA: acid phosphatase, partial [Acetobacteraceae bacterium]|nr:acid phosphatase [Acetobacteraceae bacterium]
MTPRGVLLASTVIGLTVGTSAARAQQPPRLEKIQTVVMIYAENRSFDNLYGYFPGANGLADLTAHPQLDRDGMPLKELPPVWGGLTAKGVIPAVPQSATEHIQAGPFAVDDPKGLNTGFGVTTHDLWHRFYQNIVQIDGGRNDKFVAWADSGGLVMGHYDGSSLPMWPVAKKYVLADNFFMGAFGGSFLNHVYLACACAPVYPDADKSPARPSISAVEPDGVTLKVAADSPKSAMDGIPIFVSDGNITPDFYAVNTMQPPYQPSANKPAPGGDPALADPSKPTTLPPQHEATIGEFLSAKGT